MAHDIGWEYFGRSGNGKIAETVEKLKTVFIAPNSPFTPLWSVATKVPLPRRGI
jgi:hypothetical protein